MALISLVIASSAITMVLIVSFGYLYFSERKPYILMWILSLMMLLAAYLSRLVILNTGHEYFSLLIVNYISTIYGYWFIFKGTGMFFKERQSRLWDMCAGCLSVFFILLKVSGSTVFPLLLVSVAYAAALMARSGLACSRALKPKGFIRKILGFAFFLWAAATLLYPVCNMIRIIPLYYGYMVIGIAGLITLIGLQSLYFQSVKEDLEQKEANIKNLLVYDKLTGAYNRTYFEQILEEFYEEFTMPVGLAVGDVNGLKLINDTFGHKKGDELLEDIVKIIKESIGEKNSVVRWGGDEFIIVMPETSLKEAEWIIKKIKSNFKLLWSKTVPIDISIGLSIINDRDSSIDDVIKQAEESMYRNKLNESKKTRMAIIEFLEKLLWEKDYQTEEHVMRLKSLVCKIGRQIGLSPREIDDLAQVAILHDIGKIGVPAEILNKPGSLTPDEWSTMKKHSEIGYRIANSSRELAHISEAILAHHEWWNGSGYPQGLKGEEIPLYSRIVAIVDSYDVITHDRPYKRAIGASDALIEIGRFIGIQYDPHLTNVFINIMREDPSYDNEESEESEEYERIN